MKDFYCIACGGKSSSSRDYNLYFCSWCERMRSAKDKDNLKNGRGVEGLKTNKDIIKLNERGEV